jgi:hypothetical protein
MEEAPSPCSHTDKPVSSPFQGSVPSEMLTRVQLLGEPGQQPLLKGLGHEIEMGRAVHGLDELDNPLLEHMPRRILDFR